MRKLTLIFILGFYSLMAFGLEAKLHFCCGELQAIHFFEFGDEHHDESHSEHKGCCHSEDCNEDVHIALQYESEHEQCASPSVLQLFASTPEPTYFLFYVEGNCQSANAQPTSHVPLIFERYSLFCCRKVPTGLVRKADVSQRD
jgi:hypothetical protein